jgi:hypothetical protein
LAEAGPDGGGCGAGMAAPRLAPHPRLSQLPNFGLLEDRETEDIELYLTKLGARLEDMW